MSGERSNKVEFLTAIYEIDGPASSAQKTAERICFDQTIEAEDGLLPPHFNQKSWGRSRTYKKQLEDGTKSPFAFGVNF